MPNLRSAGSHFILLQNQLINQQTNQLITSNPQTRKPKPRKPKPLNLRFFNP
jgi:hypothetical protein